MEKAIFEFMFSTVCRIGEIVELEKNDINWSIQSAIVGGMGSFLQNLFHVIDCEQIWVNQMQGTPVIIKDINNRSSLEEVKRFSDQTKKVTQNFIKSYTSKGEDRFLEINSRIGK